MLKISKKIPAHYGAIRKIFSGIINIDQTKFNIFKTALPCQQSRNSCGCAGKPIECKAAVLWGKDKPFCVEKVIVDPPKKGEVRLKMVATGVCHTDMYNFGDFFNPGRFPIIRGHEGAGIVESVGPDCKRLCVGDHVIPTFMPECRKCKFCKHGDTNFCSALFKAQPFGTMLDGTTRFKCRGKNIYHFMGVSSFAEYTVVHEISCAKISKAAPLDKVCLLGCGISTGYGGAINTANVQKGSTCAIWGLGGIGLATAMGCKKAGAKIIYGIDTNLKKCEISSKFGVTHFLDPKDIKGPLQDFLKRKTGGGFDYTFECIGDAQVMRTALESTHIGWGKSVILGVDISGKEIQTLPRNILPGRTWTGSSFGGYKTISCIPGLVDQYLDCDLMIDEFITHTMRLDSINDAFELMSKGRCLRCVLFMEH